MMRFIRLINLALCAVVVWQGLLLMQSKPVFAQAAPFLYRPYYGNFPGFSASFDHNLPNYGINWVFTRWQGDSAYSPPHDISATGCNVGGSYCYDGHDGYDILLAYEPVVAAADGQTNYAGWHSTAHDTLLGLMARVDHGNNYRTIYGHLSMVRYLTNTNVGRWQIGTSGTTGNSTGPHLHFQVERYYNSQWRVTDPYGWRDQYNNNDNGDDLWAGHADGVISTWLWVANPLQSPPPNNGTYYKDDGDSGFTTQCLSGNYWWLVNNAGYNNDLRYTFSNGTTVNCWANWQTPNLPSTGQYEVEVYIPVWDAVNRSHAARYRVKHAAGEQTVVVDQHRIGYSSGSYAGAGYWISLGRYNFTQGSPVTEFIQLADATYIGGDVESSGTNRKLLVDAVRLIKTH